MLLVGCPLDKARQIADDVCRSIAAYRFVWHEMMRSGRCVPPSCGSFMV
jgi:hypothetical protein